MQTAFCYTGRQNRFRSGSGFSYLILIIYDRSAAFSLRVLFNCSAD